MLLRAFFEKTLTESALRKEKKKNSHVNQRGEGFGFKLDTGPVDPVCSLVTTH